VHAPPTAAPTCCATPGRRGNRPEAHQVDILT
jgi:hypothetical protein